MQTSLRILCLEDNPLDAELIQATLEGEGITYEMKRVETHEDFLTALERGCFDLILADYALPSFDGISALTMAREMCPDVPFIFVSGFLGEEAAIECLKRGATDYVLKHKLSRLVPSVRRALDEVQQRTARKRAEQQIQFQASLLDQVRNGIISTDENGNIVYWNKYAEALFQWKAEEVIGKNIRDVTVPSKNLQFAEEIMNNLQKIGHWEGEFEVQRKDGSMFSAYIINTAINNGNGKGIVGVSIDITEHKHLEEQLRQSQKMEAIGRLAGGVAHDFNNLLTAIIGYSQMLLHRFKQDEQVRAEVEEIEKAGKRAAALTSQLLAFSRKQTLQSKMLNLNTVVTDLERLLRRLIGADIELVTTLQPDLFYVKADLGQIEQVIMNLAVNARDAMPQGGKLIIETANIHLGEDCASELIDIQPGPYVILAVSDTGCGMDETTKARIFEPFFTTKEVGKGTGLGLSTVYGIAKQSGGRIEVYSEPGQGTTFKIYLPRFEEVVDTLPQQDVPDLLPRGTETVLLVEDELSVRELTSRVLCEQGYTVLEASNGKDALEITEQHPGKEIHLLLTDVVMPQMGGKVLAAQLKILQPNIKLLFTSGYTDDAIIYNGVLDADIPFIQKPFMPGALARKVREVLDAPRSDNQPLPRWMNTGNL